AFYEKFPSVPVTEGSGQIDCISVPDTCKPAYGYYGMENTAGSCAVVCNCRGNKRETQNNDNVCCSPKTGYKAYAHSNPTASMTESQYCIYCPSNQDFNPQTNSCCPEFSVYNGNACTCVEGYQMKDGACHRVGCASGLHFDPDTETCVINPPIQTSKRFCELINDNWNTASHNCNTFSNHIYSDVYNAALGTNGKYISIMSKIGAFKNINPNIVFQNGLKLWILGDKAASIPGLSFTTEGISSNQNICKEKLNGTKYIASKEACLASSSNGEYFCQGEGHCYSLVSGADKMGDARNCCASTDLSTISYAANYDKDNRYFAINGFTVFVDINGNKGSGTLWEDVFPFYVSSNGVVYPAYPLDGDKSKNAGDSTLYKAGNGVDSLSVDVYYYDSEGGTDYARKKVLAYSNVSYARGACFSRKVDLNTPYCQNLGLKVKGSGSDANIKSAIESPTNPCNSHPCTVTVRNKLRFF
ncbi:hypothetical protein HDR58_03475, partial [bacterium]|nr:hypothetical protein [bacterium]